PVQGTRCVSRVNMRHGVSRLCSGKRQTMGLKLGRAPLDETHAHRDSGPNAAARKVVGSTEYILRKPREKLLRTQKPASWAIWATGVSVVTSSSRARRRRATRSRLIGVCPIVCVKRAANEERLIPAMAASDSTVKGSEERSKIARRARPRRGSGT